MSPSLLISKEMHFFVNPRHLFAILKEVGHIGQTKFRLCLITIYIIILTLEYSKVANLELKWWQKNTYVEEGAGKSNTNSAGKNAN